MQYLRLAVLTLSLSFVAACAKVDETEEGGVHFDSMALFDPVPVNPADSAAVPFPFDGFFAGFNDPTLNIPNTSNAPFVTAANLTDGFSTTASMFLDLLGFVDFGSLSTGLIVIENGATLRLLQPGVDYVVQPSFAIAQVPGSNPAVWMPIFQQRSRVLIEPLKPLAESTQYVVVLTTAVENLDGGHVIPSATFKVARSATPVAEQTDPYLDNFTDGQKATLEALRAGVIRPVVEALGAAPLGLAEDDIALAWSFTTQSITKSLTAINTAAAARTIGVVSTGLNTQQANAALQPTANIFAGTFSTPYYLATPSNPLSDETAAPTNPLTKYWRADATAPDTSATFLGLVPCGAFAVGATVNGQTAVASASTTTCYPMPRKRSDETVPLMVTVPNSSAPGTCGGRGTIGTGTTCVAPASGWPVVVFQHGITGNRTQMLAIAPTLASAGMVTVAIDLPLHGLVPSGSAATCGALSSNAFVTSVERTFGLDLVSNTTGAAGPDGVVDCSGTHFINLSSLITSRDNLRQASADLIHLVKSLNALNFDGDTGTDEIDETNIRFIGHSLGGIVGVPMLAVNTDVEAASLAMPGGGVAKLLDASATFGPRIAAGLAASGVVEGTDTYETFERFAQHLTDPGDPINYAAAAAAGHSIHLIEVIGDTVVPNAADSTCPATLSASAAGGTASAAAAALLAQCPGSTTQDETPITGYLSGTDPLYQQMGLQVVGPLSVDLAASPPVAAQTPLTGADVDAVVQFANGNHGSILDPSGSTTNAVVTCHMQKQVASFLATGGTALPIGGDCP